MPRRQHPLQPGRYYHLYNRGNNRGRIFFEEENYLFFLRKVHRYLLPVFDVVAYCLMPTHYHLLVKVKEVHKTPGEDDTSEVSETSEVFFPDESPVSEALRRFSISCTKAINERFDRVGALFQGAYQAKPVAEESYLVSLSRYLHRNPVSAGLVETPAAWSFSSYRDFVGERTGRLPCPDVVLDAFASRKAYRRFVERRPRRGNEGDEWKSALFEDQQDTGMTYTSDT